MANRLLVIEGEDASTDRGIYASVARDEAFVCHRIDWSAATAESVRATEVDLVVMAVVADTGRMTALFECVRTRALRTPVICVIPSDVDESLLRLVMRIADDFIISPARSLELRYRIDRLLAPPRDEAGVSRHLLEELERTNVVGRHPAFVRAIEQIPRFARSDASVLITGETGTGKELCARAIHHLSRRRNYPFIAVDCAAVPDQLFENELFGHARGAFTDAHRDHKGLVAMADGGTLFLDEIDALSLPAQAKLLRFLQEHSFRALGSDRFDRANVKVVAATNKDLEACVKDRQLRSDLYFRLNVLRLHLPPLRERPADIPLLAYGFLQDITGVAESQPNSFSSAALRILAMHHWPGNVRELYNVVQRAVVACDGATILPAHLSLDTAQTAEASAAGDFRAARAAAVAEFERRYVEEMLRKHRGNVTHAAREAQQDRRAFGRFIKKYQIRRTI